MEYIGLPIVYDQNIKDQYIDPSSFVNNRGIGITVSAKDPVRIIKFFDNLLTDENQILSNWGIKGETYDVDKKDAFTGLRSKLSRLVRTRSANHSGSNILNIVGRDTVAVLPCLTVTRLAPDGSLRLRVCPTPREIKSY